MVTVASLLDQAFAESSDKGKEVVQLPQVLTVSQPIETMSDVCKGMEWPVHFSTLMLCTLNDWSPWDSTDIPPNAELNQHNAQSSQTSADIDLNIVLPLEPSEGVSKFLAEMNKLEELQKQAAQSY